jgi:hypothetical protein
MRGAPWGLSGASTRRSHGTPSSARRRKVPSLRGEAGGDRGGAGAGTTWHGFPSRQGVESAEVHLCERGHCPGQGAWRQPAARVGERDLCIGARAVPSADSDGDVGLRNRGTRHHRRASGRDRSHRPADPLALPARSRGTFLSRESPPGLPDAACVPARVLRGPRSGIDETAPSARPAPRAAHRQPPGRPPDLGPMPRLHLDRHPCNHAGAKE